MTEQSAKYVRIASELFEGLANPKSVLPTQADLAHEVNNAIDALTSAQVSEDCSWCKRKMDLILNAARELRGRIRAGDGKRAIREDAKTLAAASKELSELMPLAEEFHKKYEQKGSALRAIDRAPLTREYTEERVHRGPDGETHMEVVRGVETEPVAVGGGAKYPDGRSVPKVGDKVFKAIPGFGGTVAYGYGEVVKGRGGALRVRLTETAGLVGGKQGAKGTRGLDPSWTVKGEEDPTSRSMREMETRHEAQRRDDALRHAEAAEQREVTLQHARASGRQTLADLPPDQWVGLRVEDAAQGGAGGVVTEVGEFKGVWTPFVRFDYYEKEGRTSGGSANAKFLVVAPETVKHPDQPVKDIASLTKAGSELRQLRDQFTADNASPELQAEVRGLIDRMSRPVHYREQILDAARALPSNLVDRDKWGDKAMTEEYWASSSSFKEDPYSVLDRVRHQVRQAYGVNPLLEAQKSIDKAVASRGSGADDLSYSDTRPVNWAVTDGLTWRVDNTHSSREAAENYAKSLMRDSYIPGVGFGRYTDFQTLARVTKMPDGKFAVETKWGAPKKGVPYQPADYARAQELWNDTRLQWRPKVAERLGLKNPKHYADEIVNFSQFDRDEVVRFIRAGNSPYAGLPAESSHAQWLKNAEGERVLPPEQGVVRAPGQVDREAAQAAYKEKMADRNLIYSPTRKDPDQVADALERLDARIWDELGIRDGSQLRESADLQRKYVQLLNQELGGGHPSPRYSKKVFDKLENDNWHTMNEAMGHLGYFKGANPHPDVVTLPAVFGADVPRSEVDKSDMDRTRAAAEIRKLLKAQFPQTPFEVRLKRFSGGNSIDIHWEDGPTTKQVDSIVKPYEDLDRDEATGEILLGGNSYVMTQRRESAAAMDWARRERDTKYLKADWQSPYDWDNKVVQIWAETDFSDGTPRKFGEGLVLGGNLNSVQHTPEEQALIDDAIAGDPGERGEMLDNLTSGAPILKKENGEPRLPAIQAIREKRPRVTRFIKELREKEE